MYQEKIIELTKAVSLGGSGGFSGHCPVHGDKNKSLSITFKEEGENPLLKCHAGCRQEELVSFFRKHGLWKNRLLDDHFESVGLARKMWGESTLLNGACLGSIYLEKRGLNFRDNGYPESIRFLNNAIFKSSDGKKFKSPCLIFKIQDVNGNLIGIQRIFLNEKGDKISSDGSSKKLLGRSSKGFILFKSKLDKNERIHVGEGPETALAVFLATNETTISMISAGNLQHIPTSKTYKTIHLWADRDQSKTGEVFARKALTAITKSGLECILHLPTQKIPLGKKSVDYLDVYNLHKGPEEISDEVKGGEKIHDYPLELVEIDNDLPEVDSSYLPDFLWNWARDNAKRLQVKPEEIIAPSFSVIGASLGPYRKIQVKKNDNWSVVANLWCMVVALPGSKKTPLIKLAVEPMLSLDDKVMQIYFDSLLKNKVEIKARKNQIDKLYKEMEGVDVETIKKIESLEEEILEISRKPDRVIVQQLTVERLIDVLSETEHGLVVYQDELSSMISSFVKRGHESERSFYLQGWNGDSSYRYETVSRDLKFVGMNCLTIIGGVQPSVIKPIIKKAISGLEDDGLIQRFQLAIFADPVKNRSFVDVGVDKLINGKYRDLIIKLIAQRPKRVELTDKNGKKTGESEVPLEIFRLDSKAYARLAQYFEKLEEKIEHETSEVFKGHLNKFYNLLPGLILIFHAIEAQGKDLNPLVKIESVEYAIKWCDLFEAHARKIYGIGFTTGLSSANELANRIISRQVTSGMSLSEIKKKEWKGLRQEEEIEFAVDILREHNWLETQDRPTTTKGGRPTIEIKLNALMDEFISSRSSKGDIHE